MTEREDSRFAEIEERYAGYQVYDRDYDKVGKVDDLFVDHRDEAEYIGVKTGFLGAGSTLIPFELVRVNDQRRLVKVDSDRETIKEAPTFDDAGEISYDFEERVHRHYGLELHESPEYSRDSEHGYGPYYGVYDRNVDSGGVDTEYGERAGDHAGQPTEELAGGQTPAGAYEERGDRAPEGERGARRESAGFEAGSPGSTADAGPGMTMGDREGGELREHPPEREGVGEPGSDVGDEDELRVGRTEEELEAHKREREAGGVNVRKRVRTDRERMTIPKRRERVRVERVPASGETPESEIGEDEVRIPVTEEEVEVTRRPVQKEEIRIRKEAVEEEEIVEEDVRREEVEVDEEKDAPRDQ